MALPYFFERILFGQIDWAPQGAKWYYTYNLWFPGFTNQVIEVSVTGDTVIQGKNCSIFEKTNLAMYPWNWECNNQDQDLEYMFEENGKVYFYDSFDGVFRLLYDFDAQPGESWKVPLCEEKFYNDSLEIYVDSISSEVLGGQLVKILHVRDDFWNFPARIYEGIGYSRGMFYASQNVITVDAGIGNLRCYDSPATGLLKFIDEPCDSIPVATSEIEKLPFQLYLQPNPASGDCTVNFHLPTTATAEILLSDSYGRILQRRPLPPGSESLTLRGLEQGLYFVILKVDGRVVRTEKFIKQ